MEVIEAELKDTLLRKKLFVYQINSAFKISEANFKIQYDAFTVEDILYEYLVIKFPDHLAVRLCTGDSYNELFEEIYDLLDMKSALEVSRYKKLKSKSESIYAISLEEM